MYITRRLSDGVDADAIFRGGGDRDEMKKMLKVSGVIIKDRSQVQEFIEAV